MGSSGGGAAVTSPAELLAQQHDAAGRGPLSCALTAGAAGWHRDAR